MKREQRQARLATALGKMVLKAEEAIEAAARQEKIHPTDLRCLSLLSSSRSPVSPKEIITALGLTSGSGTALFDRLEKHGYISRIANTQDRRGVLIVLDRSAAEKPLAVLANLRARYSRITERFSDVELEVISEFLEAVSSIGSSD